MEDWTQENLAKLSVKELKLLAKKSNVNPNFKKAELVMALLSNVKDIADTDKTCDAQTSRRMTRSRVSLWQASEELSDCVKEVKPKVKFINNKNSSSKGFVDDKRTLRKKESVADVINGIDTSEMFPLVSSIRLASKPLKEITNNEVRVEQNKLNEFESAALTKKSKRNKTKKQISEEALPTENLDEITSAVNPCLGAESDKHEDIGLNNSFNIERKRRASPDVNRKSKKIKQVEKEHIDDKQNLHPSKQLNKQLPTTNETNNKPEISQENQDIKICSVVEVESYSEKQKLGQKRKSETSVGLLNKSTENSALEKVSLKNPDLIENTQVSKKRKKKKDNDDNVVKAVKKTTCGTENSPVKNLDLHEISNKSEMSTSNKSEIIDDSLKTETKTHSPTEKSICKKGDQPLKKRKRVKSKQVAKVEHDSLKTQEITGLVETTSNNTFEALSMRNMSLLHEQNEAMVMNTNENDSLKNSLTNEHSISNKDESEDKAISTGEGETGQKAIQAPIRSSTFILSDSRVSGQTAEMPVPVPRRNSTFILSDSDGRSPQRRSLRFSSGLALEVKASASPSGGKLEKSIGHRIMKSSMKQGNGKTLTKEQGSAVKKTIVKNTRTGSVFKKSPATKMPNFKKIHQQLFNNMESLSDHKQRQQQRARGLLLSPVPRCAVLSPKPNTAVTVEKSPLRPIQNTNVKTPVAPSPLATKVKTPVAPSPLATKVKTPVAPSPLATKVKTPVAPSPLATKVKTPVAPSPLATKLKTPVVSRTAVAVRKPAPTAASVNRFGFRKPVKKEEATSIIGKKLPTVNVDKKKEVERNVLKGVRMNKRFMLQMQMRQGAKNN